MTSSPSAPPVAPQLVRPVVSTQWLADHLGSDGLVVLDASVLQIPGRDGGSYYLSGFDQYLVSAGHIPGAVFADLLEVFSDPDGEYAFTRPQAEQFEAAVASVGVGNDTTVVVYDSSAGQWAARIWWLFRAFGYDHVAVLDGGLTAWSAEDRPIDLGNVVPREGRTFTARPRPELWVDKEYVHDVLAGSEDAALVCGLPHKEFTGETGDRLRPGHIPGSFSVPGNRLVGREGRVMLTPDELRDKFAPALQKSHRVVAYCAGGIVAATDALALTLIGERDVAIYDGSLNDWVADPEAPVVTGPN